MNGRKNFGRKNRVLQRDRVPTTEAQTREGILLQCHLPYRLKYGRLKL